MYPVGLRVRIANIADPPFPSIIGEIGEVIQILSKSTEFGALYDVRLNNNQQRYACFENEIEEATGDR